MSRSGGWLLGLESALQHSNQVSLSISFLANKKSNPRRVGKVDYYPIEDYFFASRLGRIIRRSFKIQRDRILLEKMLKVIAIAKPDLIHIHGSEQVFGLVQKFTSIPCLISIQGILNVLKDKYFGRFSYESVRKASSFKDGLTRRTFIHHYNLILDAAKRESEILKHSKSIIGRTMFDKDIISQMCNSHNYFHCDEILRKTFYSPKTRLERNPSREFRIVSILGDALYKGYDVILETAQLLKQQYNFRFRWHVIGLHEGSQSVRICESIISISHKDVNVKLGGPMNEHEIINELIQSDIYCQASYIENSSNSLCEAMIQGVPVIATKVGGTPSLFDDQCFKNLVSPQDPSALANKIYECQKEYSRFVEESRQNQDLAVKRHDVNSVLQQYLNCYRQVLQ